MEKILKRKLLVTGATGFVGRSLCCRLLADGWEVRGTKRATGQAYRQAGDLELADVESLGADTPWSHALSGIDTVIHLAARVHLMSDPSHDPLAEFLKVNTAGTERLAREAARAGVRRLVFVSSIKVNGEETSETISEDSPVRPTDPYGISKWQAEQVLRRIEAETGLEVVVVRPTLVYGPGVRANFWKMMKVVHSGIPMPFASVANQRSMIYVENLVDALLACAIEPHAAGQTFLVSDGEDVSTPELIRLTASVLGVPARLFPVPTSLLELAGRVTGKNAAVSRLTGSLLVDSSRIRMQLDWQPPFTMRAGLQATADWYLKNQGDLS